MQVNLAASQERCAEKEAKINDCEATITAKLSEIDSANVKIRHDETIRRKLHNTILELKVCICCGTVCFNSVGVASCQTSAVKKS